MFCPKCGTKYDTDAKYCERCGESLQKSIHERNVLSKEMAESSRTGNGIKVLVVLCVILIAGIGVTAGMLLQKSANNTQVPKTQQSTSQLNQPTWHQAASYTGPGAVNGTFSIKGSQFKIAMSAVPVVNYNTNYIDVAVGSGNNLIDSGTLSWSSTESPTKKEDIISVSQGEGTYNIEINPTDIQSYNVTVLDYY